MSNAANTLYAALGVAPDADEATIEAAFKAREQALQGQPDALSLLRVAHDTLRHPEHRAAYDRKLQRAQAAASAPPPSVLTHDEAARPRSRSRFFNWLVLFAAAGGTIAWFVLTKPAPKPKKVASPSARPVADTRPAEPVPAPVATADPQPAGPSEAMSAPAAPAASAAANEPAVAAAPVAERPTRGAKQPGFDARYLAWSVFTVRQRNLTGSGVMIGPERILTNCHVLAGGATNGLVVINGMSRQMSKVEKYARLDGEDACLLYAPGAGSDAVAWGSSSALRAGDTVHAMGHPGGSADIIWSEGAFRMRAEKGGETFLLSDNYCRPGSSGGPLLNDEGQLVGVVTAVQRFKAKGGDPQYGACVSVTEATARALLSKPLFPIALAPAQYVPNY